MLLPFLVFVLNDQLWVELTWQYHDINKMYIWMVIININNETVNYVSNQYLIIHMINTESSLLISNEPTISKLRLTRLPKTRHLS